MRLAHFASSEDRVATTPGRETTEQQIHEADYAALEVGGILEGCPSG
ncbi:MAG: hypothetical protein OD811_02300 [Alphaproteobacteria bacterium]